MALPETVEFALVPGKEKQSYVRTDIHLEARAEIVELKKELERGQPHAQFGKSMLTMFEGMAEPELRSGSSPADGYILVYERQKDRINELEAIIRSTFAISEGPGPGEYTMLHGQFCVEEETKAAIIEICKPRSDAPTAPGAAP